MVRFLSVKVLQPAIYFIPRIFGCTLYFVCRLLNWVINMNFSLEMCFQKYIELLAFLKEKFRSSTTLLSSIVSRAILKLLNLFGIPNWDPKLSKVFISDESFCYHFCHRATRAMFWAIQNAKLSKFSGALPLDPTRETLQHLPDSPAAQGIFSLLCSLKNQHLQKIAGYSTIIFDSVLFLLIIWFLSFSFFNEQRFYSFPESFVVS